MSNRKKRKLVSDINVVPYIDVMLVLLIIFMVTAPLLTQGVKVDLPQADAEVVEASDVTFLVASINANGEYFIAVNGEQDGGAKTLDELSTLVAAYLKTEPNAQLVVRGDKNVAYGKVVQLMASLQQTTKLETIGLLTEPSQ